MSSCSCGCRWLEGFVWTWIKDQDSSQWVARVDVFNPLEIFHGPVSVTFFYDCLDYVNNADTRVQVEQKELSGGDNDDIVQT